MKLVIIGTKRYSINMCDFDLMFRKSKHEIVKVFYHKDTAGKGWFKTGKYKPSTRNSIVTKLTELPHESWQYNGELKKKLSDLDFDCICFGNGTDPAQLWIKERFPNKKYLYSEYGWLPWNQCFFIDEKGTGANSFVSKASLEDMKSILNKYQIKHNESEIKYIKDTLKKGNPANFGKFVYVPLQVDTPLSDGKPDFKFRFTSFKSNLEFLGFVKKLVPDEFNIVVKNHPAAPKPTKIPSGFIDISKSNISKYELYSKMQAMVCINSTSAIEGILFNKKVYTYGDDVFSGKLVTCSNANVRRGSEFMRSNDKRTYNMMKEKQDIFIDFMLSRQAYRHLCNDPNYVNRHYWVRSFT